MLSFVTSYNPESATFNNYESHLYLPYASDLLHNQSRRSSIILANMFMEIVVSLLALLLQENVLI